MSNTIPNVKRRANSWKRLATLAFITYLGAIVLLMFFERSILFPAPAVTIGFWQADRFGAKEFTIESVDKTKVHGWSFEKANSKKTLVFCHGNGETLGLLGRELAEIRDRWNVNVVALIPYRFGKKLFDACPSPQKELLTIRGLYDNDPWPEEFWDAGRKFVDEL